MGEIGGAVWAEFVGIGDLALAGGAGWAKIGFAVRAEIETCVDASGAVGAGVRERFPDKQVEDETDKGDAARKDKDEESPEDGVHIAAFGIAVDVTKHEEPARDDDGGKSDNAGQSEAGEFGLIAIAFVGEDGSAVVQVVDVDRYTDDEREDGQREAETDEPARDDAELVAKGGVFALAAEADEAKAFGEGFVHDVFSVVQQIKSENQKFCSPLPGACSDPPRITLRDAKKRASKASPGRAG
jgi:hypothetical protein